MFRHCLLRTALLCLSFAVSVKGYGESDFGPWSQWSACSQYCGPGVRFRTRECIRNGDCKGETMQVYTCYISKCYLSCREYFEDGYGVSGGYPLYVDGPCKKPIQTLCDQSMRFGGGWTLLVQVVTNEEWDDQAVLMRNAYVIGKKLNQTDFSVLGRADVIKNDPRYHRPFLYRLEAEDTGRWGGIWKAPNYYTFTGTYGNLTAVSLVKKFDNWISGPFAISSRMPWLPQNDDLTLLTTNDRLAQKIPWGTIVARDRWRYKIPPWIYQRMPFPRVIRYWLREHKREYKTPDIICPIETPLPVDGGYSMWSDWGPCSKSCSTGYRIRSRYCNNPRPANGGKDCSRLGLSRETRVCNPWPPCDGFPKHGPLRSSNGLCIRPSSHSCAVNDSVPLVFDTDCYSDTTWFLFRKDGSLQHACSETCVKPLGNIALNAPLEGTPVGLSFRACRGHIHSFQKTHGVAYGKAIQHLPSKQCLQSVSGNTPAKGDAVALREKCVEGWDAFKRVYTFPDPECSYGLETGLIGDSQLSSSSELSADYRSQFGRLRNRTSAWCPLGDDESPFFQIDLGYPDEIEGVATQGHEGMYWFVRKFTLSFSLDSINWIEYTSNEGGTKVFSGNSHPLTVKPNTLEPSVSARYVRIIPVQSYGRPCLRVALYRCSLRNADPYEL